MKQMKHSCEHERNAIGCCVFIDRYAASAPVMPHGLRQPEESALYTQHPLPIVLRTVRIGRRHLSDPLSLSLYPSLLIHMYIFRFFFFSFPFPK